MLHFSGGVPTRFSCRWFNPGGDGEVARGGEGGGRGKWTEGRWRELSLLLVRRMTNGLCVLVRGERKQIQTGSAVGLCRHALVYSKAIFYFFKAPFRPDLCSNTQVTAATPQAPSSLSFFCFFLMAAAALPPLFCALTSSWTRNLAEVKLLVLLGSNRRTHIPASNVKSCTFSCA